MHGNKILSDLSPTFLLSFFNDCVPIFEGADPIVEMNSTYKLHLVLRMGGQLCIALVCFVL